MKATNRTQEGGKFGAAPAYGESVIGAPSLSTNRNVGRPGAAHRAWRERRARLNLAARVQPRAVDREAVSIGVAAPVASGFLNCDGHRGESREETVVSLHVYDPG